MKSRNKLFMAALLAAPLFLLGNVSAHQTGSEHEHGAAGTAQVAQNANTNGRQLTDEEKKALQERLTKRKAELKVRLTNAEKQRLQARCKNANGPISSLSGRIKGIETSRTQVYENLVDRLTKLSTKLQDRNLDTTEFDAEIAELQEKITTFQTDLTAYKEAVSDLGSMDCAADVEAFKASLEAARSAREKLKMDVVGIKAYVNDTIKPTLKSIRDQIASQDGTDTEESGEENEQQTERTDEGN